jgi:hypothetical protein
MIKLGYVALGIVPVWRGPLSVDTPLSVRAMSSAPIHQKGTPNGQQQETE